MQQARVLAWGLACWAVLGGSDRANATNGKVIQATATTAMVADLVREVGGDRVAVEGLMGPGVDPHLYKPMASDVIKLQKADVIFYNGLVLEGKMTDLLSRMTRAGKAAHAVADSLPKELLLTPPAFEGHYDPHVWFDVSLWARCIPGVVGALSRLQPESRPYFEERGRNLEKRMTDLHAWAQAKVNELPKERRILVTSHDAYSYFGRAYEFQVVGLQGVSTVTEAGLADMAKMVDFIRRHGVKAIFVESSVSPDAIKRISQDASVKVGGELFSDSMGTPGKMEHGHDLGTYEGMIRHNLITIVQALR